jgi:hypothetical protein
MNCPNCGAENEAGVRFCVECGTPLEDQTEADDRTILSTMSEVDEEAKTVAVTQEDVAAAAAEVEAEAEATSPPEPEVAASPPDSSPPIASAGNGGGRSSRRNIIIIAVVVLILLCCCCFTLGIVSLASSGALEEIMYELSMLPISLLFV